MFSHHYCTIPHLNWYLKRCFFPRLYLGGGFLELHPMSFKMKVSYKWFYHQVLNLDRKKKLVTLSGKSHYEKRNVLGLGLPKSKSLGNFLQHLQKSKFYNDVFWRNCDLKFFSYKTSRDRKPRITKWSVWRSKWSKKSH